MDKRSKIKLYLLESVIADTKLDELELKLSECKTDSCVEKIQAEIDAIKTGQSGSLKKAAKLAALGVAGTGIAGLGGYGIANIIRGSKNPSYKNTIDREESWYSLLPGKAAQNNKNNNNNKSILSMIKHIKALEAEGRKLNNKTILDSAKILRNYIGKYGFDIKRKMSNFFEEK